MRTEKLKAENTYLREEVGLQPCAGEIIGDSEAIKNTLDRALQVAHTSVTVLLTGEAGTGKGIFPIDAGISFGEFRARR